MNRFNILAVLAISLGITTFTSGSDIHVPADYESIQEAIDAAIVDDVVIVAPGQYTEAIVLPCFSITVRSSDGPDVTTIDASGLNTSVVTCICEKWIEGTDIVLEGFTITGGTGTFDPDLAGGVFAGGGMYIKNANPTVTSCIFTENNGAEAGGGMFNNNSSPEISNCTFSHNAPTRWGGGMYNFNNSTATVSDCDFVENIGIADGAGMFNDTSSPIVTNCTFCGNSIIGGLGGQDGGGMHNTANCNPIVTNCTFVGNIAGLRGGGMWNSNCTPTVMNCTFSGNWAGSSGGGIYNDGGANPTIEDSVFCGNTQDHVFGPFNDNGNNIFGSIGCPADLNHDGVVNTIDLLALFAHWGSCFFK